MTRSTRQEGIYTGGVAMIACAVLGGGAGFVTAFYMVNVQFTDGTWPVTKFLMALEYVTGVTSAAVAVAAVFSLALAGSTLARSFGVVFGVALGWGVGFALLVGAEAYGVRPSGQWWDSLPAHLPMAVGIVGAWAGHCTSRRRLGFSRKAWRKTSAGCAIGFLVAAVGFWLLRARLGIRLNSEEAWVGMGLCATLASAVGGVLGAIWGADRNLVNEGFAVVQPLAVLPLGERGVGTPPQETGAAV